MKTLFIILFMMSLILSVTTIASATGNKHNNHKCCGKIGVQKVQSFYKHKSKAFHRNAVAKANRPKIYAMPMFRPANWK